MDDIYADMDARPTMGASMEERTHKIPLNKTIPVENWRELEIVQIGRNYVRVRHKLLEPAKEVDKAPEKVIK